MEKILNLLKKNKTKILIALFIIFFFKNCGNNRTVKKLERDKDALAGELIKVYDSLDRRNATIDSFTEKLRLNSLSIHQDYDLWISKRDRSKQLMELHTEYVKPNIAKFSKK